MFPWDRLPWDALGSGFLYLLLAALGVLGVRASGNRQPQNEKVEVTGELISNTAMNKHASAVEMNTMALMDVKNELKNHKQCMQTLIDVKKEEIKATQRSVEQTQEAQEVIEKLVRNMKALGEEMDNLRRAQR